MSKEKQIEEMAKYCHFYEDGNCTLCEELRVACDTNCDMCDFAKRLYHVGYHKASEVAREIFDKVDEIAYRYLNEAVYSGGDMIYDLNELKRKYTEGDFKDNEGT